MGEYVKIASRLPKLSPEAMSQRFEIERVCGYCKDDGYIAGYFHVPRRDVIVIRASIPIRERNPNHFLESRAVPGHADGNGAHLIARREAEDGSQALRVSILRMFERFEQQHELPTGMGQKLQLAGYRA